VEEEKEDEKVMSRRKSINGSEKKSFVTLSASKREENFIMKSHKTKKLFIS
jgi:hypothetical protein